MNRFLKGYQNQNNIIGWAIFAFALVIYSMTMERTASLWDCGEFIAGAYKLEVVHAPGAPLHALLGKIFSLLSFGDETKAAMWINFLSAVSTAFAVLFCFWTTTFFARQYLGIKGNDTSALDNLKVFGAGAVAALSCTFLDSLWFSAVEGEVYALAMFFMTGIIWGATRWYRAEGPLADRWLIFIAFMVGLSMGAHLLSMLAIPFVGMMIYAKHNEFTWKSFVIAVGISFGVLVFVLQGIFTGIVNIFAQFDYFFVMSMGLGKGSGVWFALVSLFSALILFLVSFHHPEKAKLYRKIAASLVILLMLGSIINGSDDGSLGAKGIRFLTMSAMAYVIVRADNFPSLAYRATLSIMFLIMGYSSYTMVPIRANAQVPINMNKPTDAFTMHYYLNREQFGKRPLFEGPDYTVTNNDILKDEENGGYYTYNAKSKSYIKTQTKYDRKYKEEAKRYFPRLGFSDKKTGYRSWINPTYNVVSAQDGQVLESFGADQLQEAKAYAQNQGGLVKDNLTFGDNLKFFFQYQVGYMYMRYFMWNFAGRTNDMQGRYDNEHGRWQSGISFIDNLGLFNGNHNWSNQDLPEHRANNKANNKFYLIPFALGIIGLVYSFRNNKTLAIAISAMFLITGLAFIIYINQPPWEPRERDYVLVGSLFAFCIWMGLAVLQLIDWLSRRAKNAKWVPVAAICIGLLAPVLMGSQGYDDHDRSGRTTTIDFGSNYLNSLEQNAIIFTFGDNDTYPLWYAQEVEGVRPDVRVINMSLLMQDTYYDHLRRKMNESAPLNVSLDIDDMHTDELRATAYNNFNLFKQKFKNFKINKNGNIEIQIDSAIDTTLWRNDRYKRSYNESPKMMNIELSESDNPASYVIADVIAGNINSRPIYFAMTVLDDYYEDYKNNLSLEGLAYRVTPFKSGVRFPYINNPELLYENLMNNFSFGGLKENPDMLLDENVYSAYSSLISLYSQAVASLIKTNPEKAKNLATLFLQELPIDILGRYAYGRNTNRLNYASLPPSLYKLGMIEEANAVMAFLTQYIDGELAYLSEVGEDNQTINRHRRNIISTASSAFDTKSNQDESGNNVLSLDSASYDATKTMFDVLRKYATATDLVKNETASQYSKMAIILNDSTLITEMEDARKVFRSELEASLQGPLNDYLKQREKIEKERVKKVNKANGDESEIEEINESYNYFQKVLDKEYADLGDIQLRIDNIQKFQAEYGSNPSGNEIDEVTKEGPTADSEGQVLQNPNPLVGPQLPQ